MGTIGLGLVTIGLLAVPVPVPAPAPAPAPASDPNEDLTLRVSGPPGDPGLAAYLAQKASEIWPGRVVLEISEQPGSGLDIAVTWHTKRQLSVTIAWSGEVLTERTVEVTDLVQAKVTLWLLIKSSIGRVLKEARAREVPPDAARIRKGAEASDVASIQTQSHPDKTAAIAAGPGPGRAIGALLRVWLETPKLLSLGIAAAVDLQWEHLMLGAQLGYRYTPAPKNLEVHALPLTLRAGWGVGRGVTAALGLFATGELKVPVSRGRSAARLGAEAGPYGEARIPMDGRLGFIVNFAVGWRLLRQRYLHQGGNTVEHPWATTIATGVDWQ